MKVVVTQENLSKGLGIVGRAVPARPTLPITTHVLLATDQGQLKLVATNLDLAVSCWVAGKVEEEGTIAVPYRLLADLASSLPQDQVELSSPVGARDLALHCARYQARLAGRDAQEFPPIPTVTQGVAAQVDAEVLRKAIRQVEFAAAGDDTRPILTGIHARIEGSQLTLAAADGFRLAVRRLALLEPVSEPLEVVIPAVALRELARLLSGQEEPVTLLANAARSGVQVGLKGVELVSKLLQGTFPNYAQLIPKSHASRIVVNRGELLQATRSAGVFARDGSGIVRLQFSPGEELTPGRMVVTARAEEMGENRVELDAVVEGEEARIAFNNRYLTDLLSELDAAQVALETTTPNSPGLFRPLDSDDYTHVVMPMFVQW